MLGWTCALIVLLVALLGFEAGSPGVTRSVVTAAVKVHHLSKERAGSRLCELFPDRGEVAACTRT